MDSVISAIESGKNYDELSQRLRNAISHADWKIRVKNFCIQKGLLWNESLASTACPEHEYYEELLKFYKEQLRIFPYHLAGHVIQSMRVTPYKYYMDMMLGLLREEKAYSQIPNFVAADIVRIMGIGRNEYIAILNQCKGKRFIWRVNKAIAKEFLPQEPLKVPAEVWWLVHVVNVGEMEFRQLTPEELKMLHGAVKEGTPVKSIQDITVLQGLYKRGLVFYDIPIRHDDRFSIPPLEGFVSNKNLEAGMRDPVESLLYEIFVANSQRTMVIELAGILDKDIREVKAALSVACRLGFATRITNTENSLAPESKASTGSLLGMEGVDDDNGFGATPTDLALEGVHETQQNKQNEQQVQSARDMQTERALAIVLDAEATSYLMMGALSPGLKKHSVTLFEAGRIAGQTVINEMVSELVISAEQGQQFEGEMKKLADFSAALCIVLQTAISASENRPMELLRKESLAELSKTAAARVLEHSYYALVPVTPLPPPPLPIRTTQGPVNFGLVGDGATPWLNLCLYAAAQSGPISCVFVCGRRLWRLPTQLHRCTHALIWPWLQEPKGQQNVPQVVQGTYLLAQINDQLSRHAVMVQPLYCDPETTVASTSTGMAVAGEFPCDMVDIPLPLELDKDLLTALHVKTGQEMQIVVPGSIRNALSTLGLSQCIGYLRLLPRDVCRDPQKNGMDKYSINNPGWLPLSVNLGLPVYNYQLCRKVCEQATKNNFLSSEGLRRQKEGQQRLLEHLKGVVRTYAIHKSSLVDVFAGDEEGGGLLTFHDPVSSLIFDGHRHQMVQMNDCLQGLGFF